MRHFRITSLLLGAAIMSSGCSETTPPTAAEPLPEQTLPKLEMRVDSSATNRSRLQVSNRPLGIMPAASASGQGSPFIPSTALREIAVLQPGGVDRVATHLTFHPRFNGPAGGLPRVPLIYVAANTGGPSGNGGVDIVDVEDAARPMLRNSLTFGAGINFFAAHVDRDTLYLAGVLPQPMTADPECPTCPPVRLREGAALFVIELNPADGLPRRQPKIRNVPGHVATDVQAVGPHIYVTSAQQGGLTVFERNSLIRLSHAPLANPRALFVRAASAHGGPGYTMVNNSNISGSHFGFNLFSLGSTVQLNAGIIPSFPIAGDADYKGTTVADDANHLVYSAFGAQGTGVFYENNTPPTTGLVPPGPPFSIPVLNLNNTPFADAMTQSVRPYGDFLLVGNGGAGLAVYHIDKTAPITTILGRPAPCFRPMGVLTFDGAPFSANFIHGGPGIMYVATGRGGLRIIAGQPVSAVPTGGPCSI